MFPDDKWRPGRENGEGCRSGFEDQCGRATNSAGATCQGIQRQAAGDGEMEGNFESEQYQTSLLTASTEEEQYSSCPAMSGTFRRLVFLCGVPSPISKQGLNVPRLKESRELRQCIAW